MSKAQRMQYRGRSRDIQFNPAWMRLVHGRHYDVTANQMKSGKVRCKVEDDSVACKIFYQDELEFTKEWC